MVSRSALASAPSRLTAKTFTPLMSLAWPTKSSPWLAANLDFNLANSFSKALACSLNCATLFATSLLGALSSWASCAIKACCWLIKRSAPWPVVASTRLTPAATPDSPVILNRPMSPVRFTWVPPHNSRELPMSSTRTSSPYFSPNSIMAPVFCADSMSMTRAWHSALAKISAFTMDST